MKTITEPAVEIGPIEELEAKIAPDQSSSGFLDAFGNPIPTPPRKLGQGLTNSMILGRPFSTGYLD